MAANTTPTFVLTPNVTTSNTSAANTAIDGTGTLVTGFTAGTNGSRVERIRVKCAATSAAANVNVFLYNGSTNILLTTVAVTAVTASTTVATFESVVTLGLVIQIGCRSSSLATWWCSAARATPRRQRPPMAAP